MRANRSELANYSVGEWVANSVRNINQTRGHSAENKK